jgi:hypothetical protein
VFRNLLRGNNQRKVGRGLPLEGRATMRSKRRVILRRGRMRSRQHHLERSSLYHSLIGRRGTSVTFNLRMKRKSFFSSLKGKYTINELR